MSGAITVVIPAAGAGRRMAELGGATGTPKALLEVGRPAIVEIMEGVERWLGRRFPRRRYCVVTGAGGGAIRRFLRGYYAGTAVGRRLTFFRQRRPLGPLAGALAAGVERGPVLIWLCDTLVDGAPPPLRFDSVYAGPVTGDLSRWCLAVCGGSSRLEGFVDKPAGLRGRGLALVGVYALADGALWRHVGERVMRRGLRERGEFQLSTALAAYHTRKPLRVIRLAGWRDAGASETFTRAKQERLVRLDGHRIELDWTAGLARKWIQGPAGAARLRAEARWYGAAAAANAALRPALPASARLSGGALELPYCPWPTLADWHLYRSYYEPERAERVFRDTLHFVSARMHAPAAAPAGRRARETWAMLVEKTDARLKTLDRPDLLERSLRLNGRALGSWRRMRPLFLRLAERLASAPAEDWRVIHGDLVFSNILADGTGSLRLLDPRGEYGGRLGVDGDRYYDYAKLAQCALSRYDWIKRDEFEVARLSPWSYSLSLPRAGAAGRRRWEAAFLDHCRAERLDLPRLRLFEAGLLLSLLPLHRGQPRHVTALYLTALALLKTLHAGNVRLIAACRPEDRA